MSARRSKVDWRDWRSAVARRLDRAAIIGAIGLTAFCVALMFVHSVNRASLDSAVVVLHSLYWLTTVTATLLALAGVAIVTAAVAADFAFDPYVWLVELWPELLICRGERRRPGATRA